MDKIVKRDSAPPTMCLSLDEFIVFFLFKDMDLIDRGLLIYRFLDSFLFSV